MLGPGVVVVNGAAVDYDSAHRRPGAARRETSTMRHALAALSFVAGSLLAAPACAQPAEASEAEAEEPSEENDEPGPDYLRAFLWDAAALAGGSIWYWIDDRNIVDWDFDSWETRFSERAYRFDNNEVPINWIGHPLSGAAYYGVPRANRLSVPMSFVYGVVTSFIWEFFLEFQERFSLNDFVSTPLGGVPIGEGFIRLGRWLDNAAHPALAWTLGLPVALHELLDGRAVGVEDGQPAEEDPGFADVRLDYGFAWALPGDDRAAPGFDVSRFGMRGRFVALRGYRQPGEGIDGFYDAEVTRMRMDALVSSTGAGFELEADTIVAGVHAWALRERGDALFGHVAIVGTSVSHLFRFENFDPWHERLAFTGFPGLAVELEEHLGLASVTFDGRMQLLFGASNASHEVRRWVRAHPDAVPASLLTRHAYWNGWGWTARGRLEVRVGPVFLSALGRYVAIDSQEGYDRNQADVTREADGYGQLLETALEARVHVGELVVVRARWTGQRRFSSLDEITSTGRLDRLELSVGLRQ